MEDIGIMSIVLRVDGKDVKLSIEAARELKRVLNDAFPDREPFHVSPGKYIYDECHGCPRRICCPEPPYEIWCTNISGDALVCGNTSVNTG